MEIQRDESVYKNKIDRLDKAITVLHKRDDDLYTMLEYYIKDSNGSKERIKHLEIALMINNVALIVLGLTLIFKFI